MGVGIVDLIIEQLPAISGYGNCGSVLINGVKNHGAFVQSIREQCEGDVGIFLINRSKANTFHGYLCERADVQVVVNCVHGDVGEAIQYLDALLANLQAELCRNEHVWIQNCRLINCGPVGKNSAGIQWCVLETDIEYLVNNENEEV